MHLHNLTSMHGFNGKEGDRKSSFKIDSADGEKKKVKLTSHI